MKRSKYTVVERMWSKGNPYVLLEEMQVAVISMENTMEGPQTIQNRSTM